MGECARCIRRNTPTHVGKTRLASYTERGIQKHPHARGEDPPDLHKAWRQRETPPRTWGRHPLLILLGGNDRNTPTHVGKTWLRSGPATLGRKHPHARGEDPLPDDSTPSRPETPPRTWGRPGGSGLILPDDGNTPTHVGKTPPVWPCTLPTQKHPHARGEDPLSLAMRDGGLETPPRTWGRLSSSLLLCSSFRNTPTHVGKTVQLFTTLFFF